MKVKKIQAILEKKHQGCNVKNKMKKIDSVLSITEYNIEDELIDAENAIQTALESFAENDCDIESVIQSISDAIQARKTAQRKKDALEEIRDLLNEEVEIPGEY